MNKQILVLIPIVLALIGLSGFLFLENNSLKSKLETMSNKASFEKSALNDLNESFFNVYFGAALCYNYAYCTELDCSSISDAKYYSNDLRKNACLTTDFLRERKVFDAKLAELKK